MFELLLVAGAEARARDHTPTPVNANDETGVVPQPASMAGPAHVEIRGFGALSRCGGGAPAAAVARLIAGPANSS